MALNGISSLGNKADRITAKIALAAAERSTAPSTVADGSVVWTHQPFVPSSFLQWKPLTAYALNSYIRTSSALYYKCTTNGTSGASEPTWTVSTFGTRSLTTYNLSTRRWE